MQYAEYKTINELPVSVREHLPKRAQEIYRIAFNNAVNAYGPDKDLAQQVAWSAVRWKYRKDDKSGQWKVK